MVVIEDEEPIQQMFWGLALEQGKRYTQTVQGSFHVSMAAIEPKVGSKDVTSVYVKHNNQEYLLCSLQQGLLLQQSLDLGFLAGESLTLFTNGKGIVHMTGYRVFEEEMLEDDDSDDDTVMSAAMADSDDDLGMEPVSKKLKKQLALTTDGKGDRKSKLEINSDSDNDDEFNQYYGEFKNSLGVDHDEEEDDEEDEDAEFDSEEEDDEESDDEEDDDEGDDDSDMSEDEVKQVAQEIRKKLMKEEALKKTKKGLNGNVTGDTPNGKQPKQPKTPQQTKSPQQKAKSPQQAKTPQQQAKTPQTKTPQQKAKTPQQQTKTPQQKSKTPQEAKEPVKTPKQDQQSKTPQKRKLPSGITLEELKEGHGPEAKSSKMVHVYYTGKLTSGKVFDSATNGKPFKFRLGKNEVIKGWEIGIQGMKVGGKRRLTIPPNLAYGNDRSSGLPPNSTLLFDVELKAIS